MKPNMIVFVLTALTLLVSCQQSEYEQMVGRELASGERHDTLFLGLYLGMTADSFFLHCKELNQQQLVKDGPGSLSVEYKLKEALPAAATMNFYPDFYEGQVFRMPVSFHYDAWAPWNKELFADSLLPEVVLMLEEWYGDGFIEMQHPERENLRVFVKVDGNRRIRVWRKDDRFVFADFTDLLVHREAEQQEAEQAGKLN